MAGEPRREGDVLVIRFVGPFAAIARFIEKHREQLASMASAIAESPMGVRFEIDESGPMPAVAPQAQRPQGAPQGAAPSSSPANSQAPRRDGIVITPELRNQLESDPLIRAMLEGFNGNIVKVENPTE